MSRTVSSNPHIAQALSFARDNATHTYSRKLTRRMLRGRERTVAVHVFTPRQARQQTPALALLSGGALTPSANYYALGPNLMTSNPHRVLVFPDTPGTDVRSHPGLSDPAGRNWYVCSSNGSFPAGCPATVAFAAAGRGAVRGAGAVTVARPEPRSRR